MARIRKQTMFTLAQEIIDMLQELAEKENRNRSNMIETLILERYKTIKSEQKNDNL